MVNEEDLTPEEREAIKTVKWVKENPDKVEWVKCNDLLEKYADREDLLKGEH